MAKKKPTNISTHKYNHKLLCAHNPTNLSQSCVISQKSSNRMLAEVDKWLKHPASAALGGCNTNAILTKLTHKKAI